MIYKRFKIANQIITTHLQDFVAEGSEYGQFSDAENAIFLAKKIILDGGKTIELTKEQIENTWWHECIHAFQFYFNNKFDETQAQVYANFMQEIFASGAPLLLD